MSSKQGIKLIETEDLLEETEILCETGDMIYLGKQIQTQDWFCNCSKYLYKQEKAFISKERSS